MPPEIPQAEIVTVGPNGITVTGPSGQQTVALPGGAPPRTAADVATLRARRAELSRQLTSATGRRDELASELERATGVSRAGLEDRLRVLDGRIVKLEQAIERNGELLAAAPPKLASTASLPFTPPVDFRRNMELTPIIIVFTLFVLAPVAIAIARAIWKRSSMPPRQPSLSSEDSQRLVRLEQAVEAIAIEVERVSEGQRFVTNLLAESRTVPALGE